MSTIPNQSHAQQREPSIQRFSTPISGSASDRRIIMSLLATDSICTEHLVKLGHRGLERILEQRDELANVCRRLVADRDSQRSDGDQVDELDDNHPMTAIVKEAEAALVKVDAEDDAVQSMPEGWDSLPAKVREHIDDCFLSLEGMQMLMNLDFDDFDVNAFRKQVREYRQRAMEKRPL